MKTKSNAFIATIVASDSTVSRCWRRKKRRTPGDQRRRLQKMMEGPSALRRNFFAVSKLALAAVVVARLAEVASPPDLPAPAKAVPPLMNLDFESAV
ncbi:MAG TPA: hypothetical protein VM717_08150 [Chthoniobacterales bacterium]|jgi:hypothetical protein|nr:hypothetical protein [Chthoniobacterales bacterium]